MLRDQTTGLRYGALDGGNCIRGLGLCFGLGACMMGLGKEMNASNSAWLLLCGGMRVGCGARAADSAMRAKKQIAGDQWSGGGGGGGGGPRKKKNGTKCG